MPDLPKISVIIVSWNAADLLPICVKSLLSTKYPMLELVLVDNNSSDNSVNIIKPTSNLKIKIIRNSTNVGFPKAVNQGLNAATGDYFLLLNADARIGPDFFTSALRFFSNHPTAALMGPKMLNSDRTVQGSVFREPSIIATIKEFWLGQTGLTAKYSPDETRPIIVDAISGACMIFPRLTLEKIGLFTEKVFMYYEDLDYCRRIRAAGLRVYFNPQIEVIHLHGASAVKNPLAKDWRGYSRQASIWYNGSLKHYLMWFISWSGQKLRLYKT